MRDDAGEWTDYEDLPKRLQLEAHLLRPRWPRSDFRRFAFLVKPDGHLSKRSGRHELTREAAQKLDEELRLAEIPNNPAKGGIRHLKTTRFSLNREPV